MWGNPYVEGRDGDRLTVIEKYKKWFLESLRNPNFRRETETLRGKTLGCSCVPKPCHGMILAAFLDGELDVEGDLATGDRH